MTTHLYRKVISIPVGKVILEGELIIPPGSRSLVIFSHGSGSSRFSTRNNFVAKELHKGKIGTFLFDLLTKDEDELYANRFDIGLLTARLVSATSYLEQLASTKDLRMGYFGASTGAASAIMAAVALPETIHAVVSRGGRPDLAMDAASRLKAPTMLIVGEMDQDVLALNREFYNKLRCTKSLKIVHGATHLFEEPGTLNEAAWLACDWFGVHLNKTEKKTLAVV